MPQGQGSNQSIGRALWQPLRSRGCNLNVPFWRGRGKENEEWELDKKREKGGGRVLCLFVQRNRRRECGSTIRWRGGLLCAMENISKYIYIYIYIIERLIRTLITSSASSDFYQKNINSFTNKFLIRRSPDTCHQWIHSWQNKQMSDAKIVKRNVTSSSEDWHLFDSFARTAEPWSIVLIRNSIIHLKFRVLHL